MVVEIRIQGIVVLCMIGQFIVRNGRTDCVRIHKLIHVLFSLLLVLQNGFQGYSFFTTQLVRTMQHSDHIKDVLHHTALMAPNTLYKTSAPCEYNDNVLMNNAGTHSFTWRVVHCRAPTLSALEIIDVYGNVVSTAHTIGSFSCPSLKQVN